MFKKICFLFAIVFAMMSVNNGFAQAKKPVTKNKTTVKRTYTSKSVAVKPVAKNIVKDNSIRVKITTDSGVMIIKLYDSTPLHRDNFVKLVKEHFYDSLLFHRVYRDL